MATKTISWSTGTGSITATYNGSGNITLTYQGQGDSTLVTKF